MQRTSPECDGELGDLDPTAEMGSSRKRYDCPACALRFESDASGSLFEVNELLQRRVVRETLRPLPSSSAAFGGNEMRRRSGLATLVVAVVAAGGLFAASPADAANWQITVTPSTGLIDGQPVLVTGTGFTEHPLTQYVVDWTIVECNSTFLNQALDPVLVASNCDITTKPFVFVHADAAGNVSGTFRVLSTFTAGNGTSVDCRSTQCALIVAQITDAGFVGAAAPITFATAPICPHGTRPGYGYGDKKHCHPRARLS